MKPKYVVGIALGIAVVAFGYYTVSPLFRNIVMNEAAPLGASASATAEIVDTPGHAASGSVRIVEAEGREYVRYENFKTINGPDIFVYLSTDLERTVFVRDVKTICVLLYNSISRRYVPNCALFNATSL